MNEISQTVSLTEAVNRLLMDSDVPAALTIEQCSSAMAMSMTSFRRKLAQEESSFKLIQTKFLNELSVRALLTMHIKIDDLAVKLGYSERATFERAFRQKFGATPSQFRELSLLSTAQSSHQKLTQIAENMPPMPASCQQLLREKNQGNLDLERVTSIVNKDVIFSGRILGQASKAIYGRTPRTLEEAIGRNLGIDTVVNFAVVFAIQDVLHEHIADDIISRFTPVLLMAPRFFRQIRRSATFDIQLDNGKVEQILVFALLGIFLLSHKGTYKHEMMAHALQGIDDLNALNLSTHTSMGISLYSASSLVLSMWHFDASLVKQINHLDKVSRGLIKAEEQDSIVLFMLSCLYSFAAGHTDFSEQKQQAERFNITDFERAVHIFSVTVD